MSQNNRERPSPQEVKRVLQEALLRNYPNPERKGCRGSEILREMAEAEFPDEHPFWDEHVSHCSPCYREFLELRGVVRAREGRDRRNKRLSIAAAVVLVIGVGWVYLVRRQTQITRPQI